MLTISPVNNIEYYADLAKEDYYISAGEPPGKWYGLGARQLGIGGAIVEDKTYKNLMNGYSPSGDALVQNVGSKTRRNAFDCTFSCPKSVSLLWAGGGKVLRSKIKSAQQRAVKSAIDFIERNAAITRRGKEGKYVERTAGLVAATFDHCSSREQQVQIHTHALICNAAPRIDGTWGSIDSRKLYQWQKPSGAIYRAELAYQLREMGFQIEADNDSFHVSGINKDVCKAHSKRSQDINQQLSLSGIASSASKAGQYAKLSTRKYKKNVNHQELLGQWSSELATLGFTTELIDNIQQHKPAPPTEIIEQEIILEDITARRATFTQKDVCYQLAVKATTAGLNAKQTEALLKQVLTNESIVELRADDVYTPKYTTQEVIEAERLMVRTAKELSKRSAKVLNSEQIETAIELAETELGFSFDDEQLEAVYSALNGHDLSIVQGSAGAGKTTLMLAAKHAYEKAGLKVQGACIAKKAADNLSAETGIKSQTIASMIKVIDSGKNPFSKLDVLVIDEAGQLPSNDLQQIMYCANEAECKLIMTGEDKQLDAINRGGALRYLSKPEIIGTQRIQNIRRQRSEWSRQVVADLRDGRSLKALKALEQHSCMHWGENNDVTKLKLIKHWYEYQTNNPEKNTLVMAQRWKDVKDLSEIIRAIHIEEGRVGIENIPLKCSVAEKQFDFEFSCGDRIKFCRNDYTNLKVSNGTLGTIKEIRQLDNGDVELVIETDDQREVSFLASEYSDERGANICLAYALTVYSAQGTTVDGNTFTLYSGGMDRANSYVALSRNKDEAHLFINRSEIDERAGAYDAGESVNDYQRFQTLCKLMSRDNYSSLAIEQLPALDITENLSLEKSMEL